MVRLIIALMLAALPVAAHSATIVTYTGSGPGTGSEYDAISGITTPTQGTASFQLSFDLDFFCLGDTQCSVSGNQMTAHSEGTNLPTRDIALNFNYALSGFPLSAAGFLGGSQSFEYGGPDSYTTFLATIDQLDVTVADGPSMILADFQMFISARPVAVPEPASWAMLILGLGAIGTAMRRRREEAPFAA